MPTTFRVEAVIKSPSGVVHLIVRHLSDAKFEITSGSSLAGAQLRPWLDQPRRYNADGTIDLTVFAVALRHAADRERFRIGDEVTLQP